MFDIVLEEATHLHSSPGEMAIYLEEKLGSCSNFLNEENLLNRHKQPFQGRIVHVWSPQKNLDLQQLQYWWWSVPTIIKPVELLGIYKFPVLLVVVDSFFPIEWDIISESLLRTHAETVIGYVINGQNLDSIYCCHGFYSANSINEIEKFL